MDQKYFVSNKMMDWLNKHKEKHHKKGNTMYGYNIPDPKGPAGTLSARYYKDGAEILINSGVKKGYIVTPVLSPDRINKRQNGRRFKDPGDNSYTLTAQDKHGVMIERKITELTSNTSDAKRVYDTGMARTLKALGGGLGAKTGLYQTSKTEIRRLTPTECERLQGFPDGYTEGVSDTQRYKTLGNAVTVNVVTSLINKMFGGTEYDRSRL